MDIVPAAGSYDNDSDAPRILALKAKIDDELYLYEAIRHIALVLSNEISEAGGARGKKKV